MNLRVVAGVAVAVCFAFLFSVWLAFPWVGGDTPFVLDGSNALLTCLSHHQFHACGYTGQLNYWGLMSPMADWPLLQHIPDLITIGLGGDSHPTRTRVLEALNVLGVATSLVVARAVLVRAGQAAWFWGFAFVVLASPILWYARTTANEVLASSLLVCLVAAAGLPAPPAVVGLAAAAACLTKETSYPFVAALGVVALLLARRRTGKPIRNHLIAGAAGIVVALVAASLFNLVRYGSIFNKNLLNSQLHTHGLARRLEYAFGVIVSPSGGILVFWPVATLLIAAACIVPFVLRSRRRLDVRPAGVLAVVAVVLTAGFASWWTPFGWSAYGPRLFLPWILPLVLLGLLAYGDVLSSAARPLVSSPWRWVAVSLVALVFALPNIGQMWRPTATNGFFEQENPPCDAPWRGGAAKWNACQSRLMWVDRPMPLYAVHGVKTVGGITTSVLVAAAALACLALFREAAIPSREPREERRSRAVRPAT